VNAPALDRAIHERIMKHGVAYCPSVNVSVYGNNLASLVDTGSAFSCITEEYYEEYLSSEDIVVYDCSRCIEAKAANSLPIPYVGYCELQVDYLGKTISDVGFLITKLTPESSTGKVFPYPGLLGNNFREKVIAEYTAKDLETESNYYVKNILTPPSCEEAAKIQANSASLKLARVAGKGSVFIPPQSVVTINVHGAPNSGRTSTTYMVEPLVAHQHLPENILIVPTCSRISYGRAEVRVANLGDEGKTIRAGTPIGIIQSCSVSKSISETSIEIEVIDTHIVARQIVNVGKVSNKPKQEATPEWLDPLLQEAECSSAEKDKLKQLCMRYSDIFATSELDLGYTDRVVHDIPVSDDIPVKQPYRKLPFSQFEEVKEHIEELLRKGIIRESTSPYASPIVLVRKKDNSLRMCVDYRLLNKKTKKDAYPLPRIDETFDALRGASYFTSLDLASGYNQIAVADMDKEKTAFVTPCGHYEYNRMPFGLSNAPATFQRLMHKCLGDQLYQILLIFLDDLLIYSGTFSEMLSRLELVFTRLRAFGLKLNPKKCHFIKRQLTYLGHEISEEGIVTDPSKTEAISGWPVPNSLKTLRQFLGFVGYYRKFVPRFSLIARPLYDLVSKTMKDKRKEYFQACWSEDCQLAFDELKVRLMSPPILGFANYKLPFIL
jgi:hypothetical protein